MPSRARQALVRWTSGSQGVSGCGARRADSAAELEADFLTFPRIAPSPQPTSWASFARDSISSWTEASHFRAVEAENRRYRAQRTWRPHSVIPIASPTYRVSMPRSLATSKTQSGSSDSSRRSTWPTNSAIELPRQHPRGIDAFSGFASRLGRYSRPLGRAER